MKNIIGIRTYGQSLRIKVLQSTKIEFKHRDPKILYRKHHGRDWTANELHSLYIKYFIADMSIQYIAIEHQRSCKAIEKKVVLLRKALKYYEGSEVLKSLNFDTMLLYIKKLQSYSVMKTYIKIR
jgi:hypothetical protein